jgi:hypothetical protein
MNYGRYAILVLVLALRHARAQTSPFVYPQPGEVIQPNTTYGIQWYSQDSLSVDIILWNPDSLYVSDFGIPCANNACATLASNATDSGFFSWHVPADAPSSKSYQLELLFNENYGSSDYLSLPFTIQSPSERKGKGNGGRTNCSVLRFDWSYCRRCPCCTSCYRLCDLLHERAT